MRRGSSALPHVSRAALPALPRRPIFPSAIRTFQAVDFNGPTNHSVVQCVSFLEQRVHSEIFTKGNEGNEEETETASASRPFPRVAEKVTQQSGRMEVN